MRKIESVMYGKFNNHDKRGAIIQKKKDSIVLIEKTFKSYLNEEQKKLKEVNPVKVEIKDEYDDEFIWTNIFPRRRF